MGGKDADAAAAAILDTNLGWGSLKWVQFPEEHYKGWVSSLGMWLEFENISI